MPARGSPRRDGNTGGGGTGDTDNHPMNKRWKPSVTVAAVIERDFGGARKFLLVEEQTRDGLRLNNPAGHLDPGESPEQACARETLEETAFHFKPTAIVGIYLSRFEQASAGRASPLDITYLRFAFCGELGEHVPGQALDEGIVRTVWLTADEIRACAHLHRSPLLLTCMEDYLAGRRYPLDLITTDSSVLLQYS
ncbi:NUDIX hydrolase [Polaromonas sp. JS666]|nr:NUDIX hydrolase [Polaromonas sp. JS666]